MKTQDNMCLGVVMNFIYIKAQLIEELGKSDFIKVKNFYSVKDAAKRRKKQVRLRENICKIDVW